MTLMKKTKIMLEILVGLLAIVLSLIAFYPSNLNNPILSVLFVFGVFINALIMLGIGVLRLYAVFSFSALSLDEKINVFTSIVMIATAVAVLFLEVVATVHYLLHYLFGLGLLSYAAGLIVFAILAKDNKLVVRAFHVFMGFAIAIFSANVFVTFMYPLMNFEQFVSIALVLIGFDLIIYATLEVSSLIKASNQQIQQIELV
jgi:hypothetical protein